VSRSRGAPSRRRLILLSGIAPIVVVATFAISPPPFLGRLDNSTYDVLLRSATPRAPNPNIVIIDVDERSLSTVGQWPWRRDVVAQLIARLRAAEVATIALDVIFAEADRYAELGDHRAGAARDRASPDQTLAQTIKQSPVVLGYALTFDTAPLIKNRCQLHPIGVAVVGRAGDGREPVVKPPGAGGYQWML
jgi:adenylate cyclase